ncbi:carboxypeptidase-like regulatory domain-containing protein [Zunongwangia sp. F363]|uniref:Carboxypeptidase-like regulatory domain-containing protein n=1 Tax=Autumnicola tepida TaxID=3075595 RepID=A0ABU3C517_9FLAO|nr:carboxypeptidase-like regulatory domain-containing protein [Zunongwangia sp. F363]MDT0641415.1 carboxypeptidase-like regulatory domain-containing protein [Zunongwangia sp. F363]
MRRLLFYFIFSVISSLQFLSAQNISGTLKDFQTKEPIPFATVQYGANKGVVTNDEGFFSIPGEKISVDKISISSIGYETVDIPINKLEEIIYLKEKSIELADVFISDKNLSAEEIVERALARVDSNYNFNLTKKRFFFRRSYFNNVNQFDLEVEESTVPEVNQDLMDEVVAKIPDYAHSYYEYLGDFYGNQEKQKVQLIKAANLENPVNEESLEELSHRFEKILQENLGEDTFLKIKTGILGFKMDAEEINEGIEKANNPEEKTAEELEKEQVKKHKEVQETAAKLIKGQLQNMFWKEDGKLDVFEKSRKYDFAVDGYTQLDNSIVYIISFEPKRKADFRGKMYVNTEDFGIHRLDYENVKPLKKFSLFGISAKNDVYRGSMIFSRDSLGKYNPKYLEVQDGSTVGVDRPLKLMVKEDRWLFNKKLKEVDMEIRINNSDISKFQLVIYENSEIDEGTYNSLNVTEEFEFGNFKKYNPDFWTGYNIIEPNAAIKAFEVIDEEEQDL